MRTRKELIPFTLEELQRMAKDEGIDVLGRNKMGLISELLIKDKSPKPIIEESFGEIPDPVYTDRGGKQIFREETVNCRVGGKWFPGFISRFKKIEDDDYAFVLLDGAEKTKMFHTIDLEKISKTKKVSALKIVPENIKKMAEDLNKVGETIKIEIPIVIDKKVEKIVASFTEKKEKIFESKKPTGLNKFGFPVTKYDDELVGVDLCGIKYHDTVKFKVSMMSKKNPGEELIGKVNNFVYDPTAKKPYFIVKVDGDSHVYYKSINSVKLI